MDSEKPFTESTGVVNVDLRRSGLGLYCAPGKGIIKLSRQGPAWHLVSRGLAEPILSVKQSERKFVLERNAIKDLVPNRNYM